MHPSFAAGVLIIIPCILKIAVSLPLKTESWIDHARQCLQREATNGSMVIITNNVTEADTKVIDSATEIVMKNNPMVFLDVTAVLDPRTTDHQEVATKRAAFGRILKLNSNVVYFSRSDPFSAKFKDLVADSVADVSFPKIMSVDLDLQEMNSGRHLQECFQDIEVRYNANRIIANLNPTSYIDLRGNQLQGPEGKILQVLLQSVNASVSITRSRTIGPYTSNDTSDLVGMFLNLMPYQESSQYLWSMVYHPYRKLGLVPASGHGYMSGHRLLEYCLLGSVTIMIILLLYVMRRLMSLRPYLIKEPSFVFNAIEKLLFSALVLVFFVNLAVLVGALFREKYGSDRPEDQGYYRYSELPQNECLQELIKTRSVFCVVDEDFGREAVRRYGKDDRDSVLKLVPDVGFRTEWRGVYFSSPVYLEKFNRMQLRLIESGLLDKWYSDEMLSLTADEDKQIKSHLGFTKTLKMRERSRKFAFYLNLMVFDGMLMALVMFTAEWIIYAMMTPEKRRLQYVYFDKDPGVLLPIAGEPAKE